MPKKNAKKKYLKRGRTHGQKIKLVSAKNAKKHCGVCGKPLSGVAHCSSKSGIGKLSKSERRPSVPFGGVLCSNCRTITAEETAKIVSGKKIQDLDLRFKPFVETMLKRL